MSNNDGRETSLSALTLSGLRWSYLSTIVKALLSLLALVFLARLLTPTDFGLFAIAWIFVALATRFGQVGVGPAIVQRQELSNRHIQVGFTLSVVFGIAMMAIIWLFAPLIGEFFNEPTVARILQALSVIFVINAAGIIPAHLLRRQLRFKELMTADLLAYSVGYGLTAVVLAFQGFSVWSLVWGNILHRALHTILVILYSPKSLRLGWSRREAVDLLSRGAGFSLARFFEFMARRGSHFVIGRWLDATSLGYYTRADQLITLPRNHVSNSLSKVLFPAMAQRQQETGRLATIYLQGMEVLALVALPVSALLLVSAPELVLIILGEQWDAVVAILQILAFAVLFQMCDILNVAALGALGAVYRQAWRQGWHALLVVGGAWFASRWGLGAVAIAIVSAQVVAHLLLTQLTISILRTPWRQLLRRYLPALWVGAWAALALWLTARQLRAVALPVGLSFFIEFLAWFATVVMAVYYAPSQARPLSFRWAMKNVPFESLGAPGYCLRRGLGWLARDQRPD